jgi:hypothetical protein
MKYLLALALVLGLNNTGIAGELDQRDEVFKFLNEKVNNRTVSATTNTERSDFSQSWTYENLVKTGDGFTYDEVVEIKQTVYELAADGKRVGKGDSRDRNYTTRTSIGQLLGTERLIGNKQFLKSSFRETTGFIYTAQAFLDGDKLIIKFDDAQPNSWPKNPPDVGHEVMLSKHVETLWLGNDRKLNRKFTQITEILDPKTLAVTSKLPEFTAEQIEK